jgi:hypothetical protein
MLFNFGLPLLAMSQNNIRSTANRQKKKGEYLEKKSFHLGNAAAINQGRERREHICIK